MSRKILMCSEENIKKVCDYVLQNMEDENGRGEFDKETPIVSAVERIVDMIEEELNNNPGEELKVKKLFELFEDIIRASYSEYVSLKCRKAVSDNHYIINIKRTISDSQINKSYVDYFRIKNFSVIYIRCNTTDTEIYIKDNNKY